MSNRIRRTHLPCGGEVKESPAKDWRCLGCGARWSAEQWARMPMDRYKKDFRVDWLDEDTAPGRQPSRFVLEEVEEGRRRFTRVREVKP